MTRQVALTVISYSCVCCLGLISAGASSGEPLRVVSPPDLANMDGDDFGDGGTIPFRAQHLYPAADFGDLSGLPPCRRWLMQIAARPDASVGAPISSSVSQFTLRLSTSKVTELGMEFAANVGDDDTEVFNAGLTFATNVTEPSDVAHAFDYVIPFQHPFNYDPSRGNLLADFISTGFSSPFIADGRTTDRITDVINWSNTNAPLADDAYQWLQVTEFLFAAAGDFNHDSSVDEADLNLLSGEIRSGTNGPRFDLNDDHRVDIVDHDIWVHSERGTWLGDASLDGAFNSADFVQIFAVGKYETEMDADWSDGDWNADGRFNSGDMVTAFADGGYEQGPRTNVAAVPEPLSASLFLMGVMGLLRVRRSLAQD